MAGIISAAGLLMLIFSLIAYRRTGLNRLLGIAGISAVLFLQGMMIMLGLWGLIELSYEMMAATDLLMVLVLAASLFGKE